ncbi:hypothetical protein PMAC_003076 [Pneumocystis sp. 'macacae']|nr:hypothetical protein PMAC_003076 [Pneumocystis sp. 'macacae']
MTTLCVVIVMSIFGLVLINLFFQEKHILDVFCVGFDRIDVKNISENGIEMQVGGSIVVDSSKINSTVIRGLWRFSSGIIRVVTLYSSNISFLLPDYTEKRIALVTLPKFKMDIRDWHRTDFDELVFINIRNVTPLIPFFRAYFEGKLHNVNVSGNGYFNLRLFYFPKFRIFIQKSLDIQGLPQVNLYKMFNVDFVKVKDYSTVDGLEAKVQLSSKTIFSVSAPLSYLTWYALVPSCDQVKYIKIAEIISHLYYVESVNRLKVILISHILPFDNEFLESCYGSGISPLNRLVSGYLSGRHLDIYIEGHVSKFFTEAPVPLWLSYILKYMKILVPVPGFFKFNFLRTIKINKLSLVYHRKDFVFNTFFHFPEFVCDITIKMELPSAFDFHINITHIRVNLDCLDNGTAFVGLIQNDWAPSISTKLSSVLLVKTKIYHRYFRILDMIKFNEFLKKNIMKKSKNFTVYIKGNVSVKMDSHLGSFYLQEIPISENVSIEY